MKWGNVGVYCQLLNAIIVHYCLIVRYSSRLRWSGKGLMATAKRPEGTGERPTAMGERQRQSVAIAKAMVNGSGKGSIQRARAMANSQWRLGQAQQWMGNGDGERAKGWMWLSRWCCNLLGCLEQTGPAWIPSYFKRMCVSHVVPQCWLLFSLLHFSMSKVVHIWYLWLVSYSYSQFSFPWQMRWWEPEARSRGFAFIDRSVSNNLFCMACLV